MVPVTVYCYPLSREGKTRPVSVFVPALALGLILDLVLAPLLAFGSCVRPLLLLH